MKRSTVDWPWKITGAKITWPPPSSSTRSCVPEMLRSVIDTCWLGGTATSFGS
ncbi:MAG: hypothetical protein U0470_14045 [Anaerolineae bacterium]